MKIFIWTVTILMASLWCTDVRGDDTVAVYDVVVYGDSAAAVVAAVQASRLDKSVALINPSEFWGGMCASGLTASDVGNQRSIGGMAREVFHRIAQNYDRDFIRSFESHVSEGEFQKFLEEVDGIVVLGERLDLEDGVVMEGQRLVAIRMENGTTYRSRMFIDATYTGDLMALAGVSYSVGREPESLYGESLAGVRRGDTSPRPHYAQSNKDHFVANVDPYRIAGDSESGLLPFVHEIELVNGEGDHKIQAYNYRICVTNDPDNRIPWERPEGYDELDYELLLRNFEAGDHRVPILREDLPGHKQDWNAMHAVSADFAGANWQYPEADYAAREAIERAHERYGQGLYWTLANHPRVPGRIREEIGRWGLCRDEFADNNHWPYMIYIRVARRMVSDYVMTQADCSCQRLPDDPVAMGSFGMDSHVVQYFVNEEGHVRREGVIWRTPPRPYGISYRSIVPKVGECENLLVPVCLSASHVAHGSIRMEPVFMALGQSAATAACLAIDAEVTVQDLDYAMLLEQLLADGQVVSLGAGRPARAALGIKPDDLPGIIVDSETVERIGPWKQSTFTTPFLGRGYYHDDNTNKGELSVTFSVTVPTDGEYSVRLSYSPHSNRATNVPVAITHADGRSEVHVNQQLAPTIDRAFAELGTYSFEADKPAIISLTNHGTDGYVIVDAVQLVPVERD